MLKVFKQKAKEQDYEGPRIDMSLVLSEQKGSLYAPLVPPLFGSSVAVDSCGTAKEFVAHLPPPVSAVSISSASTIPSSESSSCSITSKDAGVLSDGHHPHCFLRPLHQPQLPSSLVGPRNLESVSSRGTRDSRIGPEILHSVLSPFFDGASSRSMSSSRNKFMNTSDNVHRSSMVVSSLLLNTKRTTVTEISPDVTPEVMPRPTKKPRLGSFSKTNTFSSVTGDVASPSLSLLSQEQDTIYLKPLHSFIRKQIEVFRATPKELSQPAPGRKQPIKLHQIGLRCIHCRHLPVRDRVKRAVCYPSSVSRVYHSVSDMKFDHFSSCKELPPDIRATFELLKDEAKNNRKSEKKPVGKTKGVSSSSTAKYYEESALQMGMANGSNGIFLSSPCLTPSSIPSADTKSQPAIESIHRRDQDLDNKTDGGSATNSLPSFLSSPPLSPALSDSERVQSLSSSMILNSKTVQATETATSILPVSAQDTISKKGLDLPSPMDLSSPNDAEFLNSLHCFVRKHIELFAANEEDVAAPAPGRKTRVLLGQVGIRCIHCAKLPAKDRVKRAICYPPSVQGIYHSVSNMKFDHFAICRGLPPDAREEFNNLKATCIRRGLPGNTTNTSSSRSSSSSTSDYYQKSALEKGLVDLDCSIRFKNDVCVNQRKLETFEVQKTAAVGKGGKGLGVFSGLSALALAACHAT